MTTTIDPDRGLMTLINVFDVAPDRADELVAELTRATTATLRHLDGFVSANIHRADDDARVVNYVQWTSRDAHGAMLQQPDAKAHLERCADIAKGFTPIFTEVVFSESAGD